MLARGDLAASTDFSPTGRHFACDRPSKTHKIVQLSTAKVQNAQTEEDSDVTAIELDVSHKIAGSPFGHSGIDVANDGQIVEVIADGVVLHVARAFLPELFHCLWSFETQSQRRAGMPILL